MTKDKGPRGPHALLAAPYFDPPRYIADNPNGPSTSSKYHTHEDCPSIRGIASEAMKSDIKFLEALHGHKLELCGLCKRRKPATI